MAEHANNIPPPNLQNGNEVNNIPPLPTMERLYWMIRQHQDQNKNVSAQMVAMNPENNRRQNEGSSHQNNDDPTGDEEENNTHNTRKKEETYLTTTTQGPSIHSGPFSKFIMFVALLKNFKLTTTLKPYDGTGLPQIHVTMFKYVMQVNKASVPFALSNIPHFPRNGSPSVVLITTYQIDP